MNWERIIVNALEAGVGFQTIYIALAAIGLNVHFGYTGLLNFGQSAFLAVAAYGVGTTVATFSLPLWLGVIIGLGAAILLALLLGIPTLRLRADYLAIVTIAAAEIIRLTFRSVTFEETFGGSDGRQAFAGDFYAINPYPARDYTIGSFGFNERAMWLNTVGWSLVALSCLVVFLLMRSPWGRVLKAIREDEDAVRSLGKNVYSYKLQSLMIGGVLGCLGGFVYALAQASIQPDIFGSETTFFIYTVLILGGAARVASPVVGAMIFWVVLSLTDNLLAEAVGAGYIPTSVLTSSEVGQLRYMLVGLALMLLMIYRPQGIFGDRREIALDAR